MLVQFDQRGLSTSVLVLFVVAVMWSITFLGLWVAGLEPLASPWLVIPRPTYFLWEALFIGPLLFADWILTSGFFQLTCRLLGGGGSFESAARLVALSIGVSRVALLLPALVVALCGVSNLLGPNWLSIQLETATAFGIGGLLVFFEAAWMCTLMFFAARSAHKLRPRASLLTAIPTVIVYYAFALIFVR
jgi:hypothetical protein